MLRIHVRHTRAGIYRQSGAKINPLETRNRGKRVGLPVFLIYIMIIYLRRDREKEFDLGEYCELFLSNYAKNKKIFAHDKEFSGFNRKQRSTRDRANQHFIAFVHGTRHRNELFQSSRLDTRATIENYYWPLKISSSL